MVPRAGARGQRSLIAKFRPHLQSPDFSSQSNAIQVNNLLGSVFEISFSS